MHTPSRVIVDVGNGRTMEQFRADLLVEKQGPGNEVAVRLARIEEKLDATVQACERMLAKADMFAGENLDSPVSSILNMLTKKELARRFRISTRTVDRWRSMGFDLGEVAISGTIRFDPKKISQIISTQKVRRRRK